MELNLVNYIRIDLVSPLEPPIVFKDKKAIYGYNISDGLLWIYDTEGGDRLVFGIGLSSIKTMWFNEEPYTSSGYSMSKNSKTLPKNGKWLESNLVLEGRVNDNMVLQEILKNDE